MDKIISLDFWGTVAKYNPLYSAARTRYFSDVFGLPEDVVMQRYKAVKREINQRSANFGTATTPILALTALIESMPNSPRGYDHASAAQITHDLARMFLENPPILPLGMEEVLQEAHERGVLLCLSSNTDFVSGETIRKQFGYLPLTVWTFSDLIGVAKPHREFFRTVILRAQQQRPGVAPANFVHVGDNQTCDIGGGAQAGMDTQFVNGPEETVLFINSVR